MPRQPRAELSAGVHHVFARGNGRQLIFLDDADYAAYLRLLGRTVRWERWRCLAYCLMGNHVHLLIETVRPNLGAGMHRLHGLYAQAFNKRYGRWGHLFGGRYGSVTVADDAQLWAVIRYIGLNPVSSGLCGSPEHWRWNSYRNVIDGSAPPWLDLDRLLGYLSAMGGDPIERYIKGLSP